MNKQRLNALFSPYLEEGETLICAVFGYQEIGLSKVPSYIGICENSIIIIKSRPSKYDYVTRIDFNEIKNVHVIEEKSILGRKYEIYVTTKGEEEDDTYNLIVFSQSRKLKEQKENLDTFLRYLKNNFTYTFAPDLKKLPGKTIRVQYFSAFLLLMFFAFLPLFVWLPLIALIFIGDIAYLYEGFLQLVKAFFYIFTPFIILSVLNRFFFGKVIGKTSDKEVIFKYNTFPYNRIEKIEFSPSFFARRDICDSCAIFHLKTSRGKTIQKKVFKVPFYAVWDIKRHEPNIKITLAKDSWTFMSFWIILPLITIIYGFIKAKL